MKKKRKKSLGFLGLCCCHQIMQLQRVAQATNFPNKYEHRRQTNANESLRDKSALRKHTFICLVTRTVPVSPQPKTGGTMISMYWWESRCTVLDDNTLLKPFQYNTLILHSHCDINREGTCVSSFTQQRKIQI